MWLWSGNEHNVDPRLWVRSGHEINIEGEQLHPFSQWLKNFIAQEIRNTMNMSPAETCGTGVAKKISMKPMLHFISCRILCVCVCWEGGGGGWRGGI